MTFEQALKKLAEKEPEKIRLGNLVIDGACIEVFRKKKKVAEIVLSKITQDDIDEILALIGWEYCVDRDYNLPDESPWFYEYWRTRKQSKTTNGSYAKCFPDKLSAAKAALIAVVEREYP